MPIDERVIHAALKEQKKSSESGRETAATIQVVPQRDEAEVHDASATARWEQWLRLFESVDGWLIFGSFSILCSINCFEKYGLEMVRNLKIQV